MRRGPLVLVQKKHILSRCQSEREKARMLQRLGGSKAIRNGSHVRDTLSFKWCSSSMACDMEEVRSESSKKMKVMDETTSEASWTAVTKGKENEVWSLEPEGEAETPDAIGLGSEVKGVSVKAATDMYGRRWQGRNQTRMEKKVNEKALWDEGAEIQSPKRNVSRVESEETLDCVRESLNLSRRKQKD